MSYDYAIILYRVTLIHSTALYSHEMNLFNTFDKLCSIHLSYPVSQCKCLWTQCCQGHYHFHCISIQFYGHINQVKRIWCDCAPEAAIFPIIKMCKFIFMHCAYGYTILLLFFFVLVSSCKVIIFPVDVE